MEGSTEKHHFAEPQMAKFLRKHILDTSGELIRAAWSMGLGAVPPGLTTYAPNTIERDHRTTKGLFDPGFPHQDAATLMIDACASVSGRINTGRYNGLVSNLGMPPPCLYDWRNVRKASGRGGANLDPAEWDDTQTKRLDVKRLLAHFREHGEQRTLVRAPCEVTSRAINPPSSNIPNRLAHGSRFRRASRRPRRFQHSFP